jgi:REP element-mobilizing transposase RayT
MSTYSQILYQLVFTTKNRALTLSKNNRENLYKYIWGVLQKQKCHLYQIGGVEDHIHILTHIHPMVAPALLIKDIKLSSTEFIKKEHVFNNFSGWQDGYGAFTYHIKSKNVLIEYLKNQEKHHNSVSFKDEYIKLLTEHGISYNENYLL